MSKMHLGCCLISMIISRSSGLCPKRNFVVETIRAWDAVSMVRGMVRDFGV